MTLAAHKLTATEAAAAVASGRISSVDLVKSCLEEITRTAPALKAWAHLNPQAALDQAAESDRRRRAGFALGPLHGVPVALKDIIDTADMPTERGTPIFAGRKPERSFWARRSRRNWPSFMRRKHAIRITSTTAPAGHRRGLRPLLRRPMCPCRWEPRRTDR
jgi:Asp-tRNA(Asn)/Glu-tRNA(Gln) amidotransferase A subunit family amidase